MGMIRAEKTEIRGADAIKTLAEICPQLYLEPGPAGAEEYKKIVECGEQPQSRSLSHFTCSEDDLLTEETTPAGNVSVITLHNRADFELFLRTF